MAVAVDGVTDARRRRCGANLRAAFAKKRCSACSQLVRSAVGFNAAARRSWLRSSMRSLRVCAVRTHRAPTAQAPGMFDFDNFDHNADRRTRRRTAARFAGVRVLRTAPADQRPDARRCKTASGGGPPALPGPAGAAVALPGAPVAAGLPSPEGVLADIEPAIDIAQIQGRVRASSVKKVAEVVDKHPDESMQIIRGWLNNAM